MPQLTVPGLSARADVLTVTPDLAKEWLDRNVHNRPIRKNKVVNYARDMQAGNWALNGEAVKFAVDGVLLDGQHRLLAIVAAGIPVQMLVVTGLANNTQTTMDSGVKRTTGDAFSLEGQKNSQMLAAILKKAWMWEQGDHKFNASYTPTTAECAALLRQHPEIHRSLEVAIHVRGTFRAMPPSVTGVGHYILSKVAPDEAPWFFARVGDGAVSEPGHPILALRARVTNEALTGTSVHQHQRLAYLIRAWNAVRDGRPLARIQQGPKDPMPLPK
ncbi:hypothetical protein AB0E25_33235 [Streptomyces bobili]|uniref:hypothetical protein n=1 Tax=Streptomyces bobili TaxID=67280 RepID=UPI0033D067A1